MHGRLTDKQFEVLECVAVRKSGHRGWWCKAQLQYFGEQNAKHVTGDYAIAGLSGRGWDGQLERLLSRGLIVDRFRQDTEGRWTRQFQLTNEGRAAINAHRSRARQLDALAA